MSKINGFSAYQASYTSSTVQNKKDAAKTGRADSTRKSESGKKTGASQLSDAAKNVLKDLQKQYGNMDFIVAKYETEEEAASYLSRGNKEFSVLLDPDELEAMAQDEQVRKQYTDQLDDAVKQLESMQNQIQLEEGEVLHLGVAVDPYGMKTFFADIEKANSKLHKKQAENRARTQKEFEKRMEKKAEKKKAEQKSAAQKEEKARAEKKAEARKTAEQIAAEKLETQDGTAAPMVQRVHVTGSSVEELLEKIQNVDWSQVPSRQLPDHGEKIDFSA